MTTARLVAGLFFVCFYCIPAKAGPGVTDLTDPRRAYPSERIPSSDSANLNRLEFLDATFSSSGRELAVAANDGSVRIWTFESDGAVATVGEPVMIAKHDMSDYDGKNRKVNTVAFSRSGQFLASGGNDATIRLYAAKDGVWSATEVVLKIDPKALHPIRQVIFTANDEFLVARDAKSLVGVWAFSGGTPRLQTTLDWSKEFPNANTRVTLAAHASRPEFAATLSPGRGGAGALLVHQVADSKSTRTEVPDPSWTTYSADGETLATVSGKKQVLLHARGDFSLKGTLMSASEDGFTAVACPTAKTPATRVIVATLDETGVRVWPLVDGGSKGELLPDSKTNWSDVVFTGLAVSPHGRWIATTWTSAVKGREGSNAGAGVRIWSEN